MKERQRWRSEEDSTLRAYVKQYGPREWNLVSQRMDKALDRDAKSCLERWKNYLKPGIRRDALSEDEQRLVVSLQAKYGNKWNKIAAEVPGRTAKRLGKWWEIFHEKQKQQKKSKNNLNCTAGAAESGTYDHILETFAQKRLNPDLGGGSARLPPWMIGVKIVPQAAAPSLRFPPPSLGISASDDILAGFNKPGTQISNNYGDVQDYVTDSAGDLVVRRLRTLLKELEESQRSWHLYRKETSWRLKRLEQQILSQKARKRKEKIEEIEAKVRALVEEEKTYLNKVEADHMDEVGKLRRAAEIKETQVLETWTAKHIQISDLLHNSPWNY